MKLALGAITAGIVIGVVGMIGFEATMHYTSTDAFCGESCHEMAIPRDSWQQSAHFQNAHGVSVGCADCHIPQEFVPKMLRKIEASREVWPGRYSHLRVTGDDSRFPP